MSDEDKSLAQRPASACDHPLDGHVSHGPWCEREPWDTARYMAPDPDWPLEEQRTWYAAASLVLLLNASETCRRKAAAAGDQQVKRDREKAAP